MADAVRKQTGLAVDVVEGMRGEFTVEVDGRIVAKKGQDLPTESEVVAAVNRSSRAGSPA